MASRRDLGAGEVGCLDLCRRQLWKSESLGKKKGSAPNRYRQERCHLRWCPTVVQGRQQGWRPSCQCGERARVQVEPKGATTLGALQST
jgi:hypothetical protein